MRVYLQDGLQIKLDDWHISADSRASSEADFGVISHAHADHTPRSFSGSKYVCSDLTKTLVESRVGSFNRVSKPKNTKMVKSGHIPGSTGFIFEVDGERIFYTGDFSTRDRMHLSGMNLKQDCDVLIMESTYGHPRYKFPEQDVLEEDIVNWFSKRLDDKVVCRGYSLGRAQEIERLARRAGFNNILVNKATKKMNRCISDEFSTEVYDGTLPSGSVLITSNRSHIENLSDEESTYTATFTGWANDGRYDNSSLYDRAFILSDHADFNELLSLVESVSPKKVYTIHGFKDRFAKEIERRFCIKSQSLKEGQKTLNDF